MRFQYYNSDGKNVFEDYNTPLISIGRDETCDFVITDSTVSAHHATISKIDTFYVISDTASTNGTYVNGEKVNKKKLNKGDVIQFGRFECWFDDKQMSVYRKTVKTPTSISSNLLDFNAKSGSISDLLHELETKICLRHTNLFIKTCLYEKPGTIPETIKQIGLSAKHFQNNEAFFFLSGTNKLRKKLSEKNLQQPFSTSPEKSDRGWINECISSSQECDTIYPVSIEGSLAGFLMIKFFQPEKISLTLMTRIYNEIRSICSAFTIKSSRISNKRTNIRNLYKVLAK